MDLGQIIYIVAIVGYFLYRRVTKKKAGETETSEDPSVDPPQKGLSFEDLLREIRDSQVPKLPEAAPKRQVIPQPVAATETVTERSIPKRVKEQALEVEAESRYYAGAYEGNKKNPYQELANRNFAEPESIKVKSFEMKVVTPNRYAELLKNPKTFRQAIVVSEILRPKHF